MVRDRRAEDKAAFKEAFKEVVQEKLAELGWWTIKGMSTLVAAILLYLYFAAKGWSLH